MPSRMVLDYMYMYLTRANTLDYYYDTYALKYMCVAH